MTDDPMLDGITRFDHIVSTKDEVLPVMVANGEYVLFSDLPALLARVREDERERHANELDVAVAKARAEVVTVDLEGDFNYVKGYNDGLVEGDAKGRREGERIGAERGALSAMAQGWGGAGWNEGHAAGVIAGEQKAVAAALERIELLNKERGFGVSSEFYEMAGDSYAEGWTDLLGLIRLTFASMTGESDG